VALIVAAGYLLRLSFDRGWISPVMRCIGGAVSGFVVGAIGWRLQSRYRTYGAALIGCGAAIIYLSVWAGARFYDVLPPTTGIVGLALVSVALAMIAYAIDVEALGTTAALGAFFAPILLGKDQADAGLLLLYLACMAAGLGLVAARRNWRLTMFVVALSYFGVAFSGASDKGPPWGLLFYGVIGGAAGIYTGLKERWWETPWRGRVAALAWSRARVGAARTRCAVGCPGSCLQERRWPMVCACNHMGSAGSPAEWCLARTSYGRARLLRALGYGAVGNCGGHDSLGEWALEISGAWQRYSHGPWISLGARRRPGVVRNYW